MRYIYLGDKLTDERLKGMLCDPVQDDLERARRFYIRCWQSVGSSWKYQQRSKTYSSVHQWNRTQQIWHVVERLKHAHIECDDAISVINRFDKPDTLFYCDPPYVMSARRATKKPVYKQEMTDHQHIQLADKLKAIKGMAIVSGYPSDLYNDLYAGWKRLERQTTTNFNHKATECLWISPNAMEAYNYDNN